MNQGAPGKCRGKSDFVLWIELNLHKSEGQNGSGSAPQSSFMLGIRIGGSKLRSYHKFPTGDGTKVLGTITKAIEQVMDPIPAEQYKSGLGRVKNFGTNPPDCSRLIETAGDEELVGIASALIAGLNRQRPNLQCSFTSSLRSEIIRSNNSSSLVGLS